MARASHAPKSAEPAASAVVATRPLLRDVVAGGEREDAVDGVGEDAAAPATGRGSPSCAAASDEAGADHEVAGAQRAGEHGRRRAVGADPAARDRSRARRAARRRRARGPRRRRSRGWRAASRNPNVGVYRAGAMRTLGATGLPVSPLGLGLAALGRPGYINLGHHGDVGDTDVDAMERHAHEVLDAAYEGGVRYFDAARSYGRGEAFLASWLEAPRPLARRRHRRLEVGLHLHRGLARRRRRARGQGPLGRDAAPPARRDARAARRAPRALPDPLGDARERRPRRRGGARGARAPARRRASSSASRPPGRARPTRSSAPWRSAASTRCRRPGTCTSARPPPRWPPRTTPGWA